MNNKMDPDQDPISIELVDTDPESKSGTGSGSRKASIVPKKENISEISCFAFKS
jgi:hypothetical protein